jgi:hypothetical protein
MASPLGTRFSGCALITLAVLAGMSSANAATGSIAFSGAVVEPTCPTENVNLDVAISTGSVDGGVSRRLSCGDVATDSGRSYSRAVVDLDAENIGDDRLLNYFASYANVAGDEKRAKVVTRTYE